jgi:hypothetical protein
VRFLRILAKFKTEEILYRNDNDKKIAVIAAVFAVLLFTLVSCGKKMTQMMGSAHDIAHRVYSRMGIDSSEVSEADINQDDAYTLGISEEVFAQNVSEAKLYRRGELTANGSMCVMVALTEPCADALYEIIYDEYEWAPCDPADTSVFMKYGKYVVFARDSDTGIENISKAFMEESGGRASVRFSRNPM